MNTQLTFLLDEEPRDWRLDEHTREIGRLGVREARRALRSSQAKARRSENPANTRRQAA